MSGVSLLSCQSCQDILQRVQLKAEEVRSKQFILDLALEVNINDTSSTHNSNDTTNNDNNNNNNHNNSTNDNIREFDALDVTLADSIVPVMRSPME